MARLDETPPAGHATRTGNLVAETLGDVSPTHVWRLLRHHGIDLIGVGVNATPFECRKAKVHPVSLNKTYASLRN